MLSKLKKIGGGIFIAFLICLAIVPIIPTTNEFVNNLVASFVTSLSIILFAVSVAFSIFKKPKDIWLRLKNTVMNPTCYWSFKVQLSNDSEYFYNDFGDKLHHYLVGQYGIGKYTFQKIRDNKFRYTIEGIEYNLLIDNNGEIHITVDRFQVSYRAARKLLETNVTSVLEKMKNTLNITNEKYFLTIEFNGKNPYLTREVSINQDINLMNVIIEYKIASSSIRITQNSLLLVEQDFETFKKITKEFLAFSN